MDAEWLQRENRRLKQQINSLKNKIICLEEDINTQYQVSDRLKQAINRLQNQIKVTKNKNDNTKNYYEERQRQFEFVIKKIEDQLIQKTEQYQKLANKITPLLDTDTVRLKVLNEVEYPHRLQIQSKQYEIQKLKNDVFDAKRKVEQILTKMQGMTIDNQRSIRQLKTRHKIQMDNARIDMQSLKCSQAVKGSQRQIQNILKQDANHYQQCFIQSQQNLNRLRQQMQKTRDSHDSKVKQFANTISFLQKQNSRLKQMSNI